MYIYLYKNYDDLYLIVQSYSFTVIHHIPINTGRLSPWAWPYTKASGKSSQIQSYFVSDKLRESKPSDWEATAWVRGCQGGISLHVKGDWWHAVPRCGRQGLSQWLSGTLLVQICQLRVWDESSMRQMALDFIIIIFISPNISGT